VIVAAHPAFSRDQRLFEIAFRLPLRRVNKPAVRCRDN